MYSFNPAGISRPEEAIKSDAFRSPGYPLFLCLFVPLAPDALTLQTILFWQALLSTLTVGIAWWLYRDYLPAAWAGVASMLTALSPHLVAMNTYLLSETLFCLSLAAGAGMMTGLAKRPTGLTALALGGFLGAANLIRPSFQFFPFLLAGFIVWQFRLPQAKKLALILLTGFLIVLAPWHIRNLARFGKIADPKLQIDFLHHGMYPDFMFNGQRESFGFPYRFDPRSPKIAKNNSSVIRENHIFKESHRLMRVLHLPLVLLGWVGCILVWHPAAGRRLSPAGWVVARYFSLILLYFTALHMAGAPFPRYSVPLRPFLYGMSLFAAAWGWQYMRRWWAKRSGLTATTIQTREATK